MHVEHITQSTYVGTTVWNRSKIGNILKRDENEAKQNKHTQLFLYMHYQTHITEHSFE